MRPNPFFETWSIPAKHELGRFTLKSLNIAENERDYLAIMESVENIRSATPHLTWPEGLTLEKNLVELAWHQKEFEARRSFAWIIENRGTEYLGCAYVYPSIDGSRSADVAWWWRRGYQDQHEDFGILFMNWLESEEWPDLEYRKIIK
jgi:hypothetical protein